MDADTSEKIRDVISFVHSRTLSIGVYSPGDISVTNMYEEAASDLAEIIQQEIAKAVVVELQDTKSFGNPSEYIEQRIKTLTLKESEK